MSGTLPTVIARCANSKLSIFLVSWFIVLSTIIFGLCLFTFIHNSTEKRLTSNGVVHWEKTRLAADVGTLKR